MIHVENVVIHRIFFFSIRLKMKKIMEEKERK